MKHRIIKVEAGSIADQLGIIEGDKLVSIGGEPVVDWIDYQALCCSEEMRLVAERGGERHTYAFFKDEYEPLGLSFETQLMSKPRDCANKCIFCFVDQLPPEVRPSLRVKDDDWRLSLMMGNFVTLTNVSDRELERIIARRASPLYISVHATDGELRAKILGNPRGARIMEQLARLANAGLSFYAQIVLCPGVNDDEALDRTIRDLFSLHPACLALAVVPVGLTGHREGLYPIEPFDRVGAEKVLDQLDAWREKLFRACGNHFVHAADEFYLLSGRPFPEDGAYDGYPLLENGVGMIRLFETEYEEARREAEFFDVRLRRVAVLTGASFAGALKALLSRLPVPGTSVEVFAVENRFFGGRVTVAGLLTGGDLLASGLRLEEFDRVLIPDTMLRDGEDVFLDGRSLNDLKREMGSALGVSGAGGGDFFKMLTEE